MSGDDRRRAEDGKPLKAWTCKQCQTDIGVATARAIEITYYTVINTKTGRLDKRLSKSKLVCATCLGRGTITDVF